jgi:hypothetical protein
MTVFLDENLPRTLKGIFPSHTVRPSKSSHFRDRNGV